MEAADASLGLPRRGGRALWTGTGPNSAPYTLKRKKLDVRYTEKTVELFYKGHRVASHVRSFAAPGTGAKGGKTTNPAHMPEHHRAYAERSPDRYVARARKIGEATGELVERILAARRHPQLAYNSCEGVLRLGREYGRERVEAASRRALLLRAYSYKHLNATLENGLEHDLPPGDASFGDSLPTVHVNLRGAGYYQ